MHLMASAAAVLAALFAGGAASAEPLTIRIGWGVVPPELSAFTKLPANGWSGCSRKRTSIATLGCARISRRSSAT